MNTTLQTINSLHNLNIKKEDFNSFKNVKQYFDKFIKIILMDSPIFVSTLESAEKYVNENGVFPYMRSFYETFKLSDDGYDSIDAITLARYCNLLRYILEKLDPNSKMKFNLMDIVEPKFSRLVSFLSKLSVFANFIQTNGDNIKQILKACEQQKRRNDKEISNIKLREQKLLEHNYNYEDLNEYFHILYENFKSLKFEVKKQSEILKEKIKKTENMIAKNSQSKERLRELREKTLKVTAEKEALQKCIAKSPEELNDEECKWSTEFHRESEKLKNFFQTHAHFKHIAKQAPILSSTIKLYSDHLGFINNAIGNYENFHHEKLKMQRPEIEINSHLLKTNENLKREISINKEKYLSQVEEINNSKLENIRAQECIEKLDEQLKIMKISKQENLEEKVKFEKERKMIIGNFEKYEHQYREKKNSIDRNFNQSIKDFEKLYKSLNN